jgi:hypothetical protein
MPDGRKVRVPMKFTAPTLVLGSPGMVRLSATVALEGETAREFVLQLMRGVVREILPPGDPADYIANVRQEVRMEVETQIKTLRPHRAKSTMTLSMADRNGNGNTRRDVNEYTFDWHTSP